MTNPKILPPVMRDVRRYLIFEIISDNPVNYGDFVKAVWESLISFLGELGTSECKIWIIRNMYNENYQRGIIKCSHTRIEHLRIALSMIHNISELPVIIRVLGVTGTIKSARSKYFSGEENELQGNA